MHMLLEVITILLVALFLGTILLRYIMGMIYGIAEAIKWRPCDDVWKMPGQAKGRFGAFVEGFTEGYSSF